MLHYILLNEINNYANGIDINMITKNINVKSSDIEYEIKQLLNSKLIINSSK